MRSSKPRSPRELTHLAADGSARMVDVAGKAETVRTAVARAVVRLGRAFAALDASENRKGDALAVARIAGIQAAKRTAEWIPLCHPLAFDSAAVGFERRPAAREVVVTAEVKGTGKTGYEMEAMVAAAAAALTLYDMCKAAEKAIVIGPVELVSKTGGKSGDWARGAAVVTAAVQEPPARRRSPPRPPRGAPGRGRRPGGGRGGPRST